MIWWLLLIYPLVGLYIAVYCLAMYSKYEPLEEPVSKLTCFVFMFLMWPIYVWSVLPELWDAKKEALGKPAKDFEAMLERIRKEPDPQLADWDREFNELAGIEEPKKYVWEDFLDNGWDVIDDSRLCGAPEFSRGGYIPMTTELNDIVEFRVREHGSHFSL